MWVGGDGRGQAWSQTQTRKVNGEFVSIGLTGEERVLCIWGRSEQFCPCKPEIFELVEG